MATFAARHANLAGTGFHLATVSAAGAMEPLLAVIPSRQAGILGKRQLRAGHARQNAGDDAAR
ncbi:hypothetical protein [Mesorhizobium sp. M0276]|uniref:hypothetical protein n=1 Tax=Mesorhizobium sp. M0276 TaxID=2956928 RepID=UPI003338A59D